MKKRVRKPAAAATRSRSPPGAATALARYEDWLRSRGRRPFEMCEGAMRGCDWMTTWETNSFGQIGGHCSRRSNHHSRQAPDKTTFRQRIFASGASWDPRVRLQPPSAPLRTRVALVVLLPNEPLAVLGVFRLRRSK